MSLETATYINGLVAANPLGSDPLADADGHLRLIKSTLKATFPNITGPVTTTQGQLNAIFPAGGIIMWSGSVGTVPTGWLLCNGANGTPDLRDRFIVGAGNAYAVGDTGGTAAQTLVAANIPAHSHSFSGATAASGSHTHSITDPGHTHAQNSGGAGPGAVGWMSQYNSTAGNGATNNVTSASVTGISINAVGDHAHTFSGTTSSYGSGTAFDNRPPYYALAFIMKAAY